MKKSPQGERWRRLDNTAKIFPVIANEHLSNVYRISATLKEEVVPGTLQRALELSLIHISTGNLDSKNSQEITELLKYSNRKYGQTLILITHDENIALQADRLIRLEDGKIASDEKIR